MVILQMTNAYGPRTGGIRTHLDSLRPLYAERGVTAALLVPGPRASRGEDAFGPRFELAAPTLPINPDYRNIWDGRAVEAIVKRLRPDAIEILDKWTLPRLGPRLRALGLPVIGFSCERLSEVLTPYLGSSRGVRGTVRRYNRWFASRFETVVCHSRYAAAELTAAGARPPRVIPLGVDLAQFSPARRDETLRRELLSGAELLLLYVGRLVPEKGVEHLAAMMARLGPRYRLVIAGAGPAAERLRAAPQTTLLDFVADRDRLAALYASCDVFVFPSAIETFALSVLEALASGCRVAAAAGGAVAEVLPPAAGRLARPAALAAAVRAAARLSPTAASAAARARAEEFPWAATADRLLALHAELRAR